MLHWQRHLKRFNGLSGGTKICIASTCGHMLVLFALFFLYKDTCQYSITITSTMINTDVPVVFVPFYKSIKQSGLSRSKESKKSISTTLAEPVAIKKKKEKTAKKKKQTKPKISKPKKEEAHLQDVKPKPAEEKKPLPEIAKQEPQKIVEQSQSIGQEVMQAADAQDAIYVGQEEMQALQMQEYIQHEMARYWQPPAGMGELYCIIKVVFDREGEIDSITMEQSSGSALFDSAARAAASKLTCSDQMKAKEIMITFKP